MQYVRVLHAITVADLSSYLALFITNANRIHQLFTSTSIYSPTRTEFTARGEPQQPFQLATHEMG